MSAENTNAPAAPAQAAAHQPTVKLLTTTNTVAPGDACTTSDGRSGYMVAVGDKLVCEVPT